MKIYQQEGLCFVPISSGSSYLVCLGKKEDVEKMSLAEIIDAREKAVKQNQFDNLQNTAKIRQ